MTVNLQEIVLIFDVLVLFGLYIQLENIGKLVLGV